MESTARAKKRKIVYQNEFDLQQSVTTEYIDEIFTELYMFIRSKLDTTFTEKYTNAFHRMVQQVSDSTTLEMVIDSCNDLEICFTGENEYTGVRCKSCNIGCRNSGFFGYTHLDNSKMGSTQIREFRGLKSSLKNHLMSYTHGINSNLFPFNGDVATKSYVQDKVQNFKEKLEEYLVPPIPLPTVIQTEPRNTNPFSKLRTIEEVLNKAPEFRLLYHSDNEQLLGNFYGIQCTSCFNPADNTKKGFFEYSHNLGQNFAAENMAKKFRTLKENLFKHLSCKTHSVAVGKVFQPNESAIRRNELDIEAGMTLGKIAYKCIVKYQSKLSFEDEVAFTKDIGKDVGNLNHSRKFVDKIFPEMYFVLQEQTMSFLNAPVAPFLDTSPFIVYADKITPYGTTLQIIGVILFKQGKNIPILLDVVPVKHERQNGAALAQDIINTLYKFYTPSAAKKYYVGSSFDGQYIALSVPRHLLILLGFEVESDMSNELLAQTSFQSFSWDPAHLLELACGDVAKSKLFDWVEKLEQSLVNINKLHTYGKQFQRLTDIATKIGIKLMKPGSFSETRFCSYKYDVLKRFVNNYAAFYVKLSDDGDDDLNRINNGPFCLRLCGLSDIFKMIGSTSAHIQSSELLPWLCDSFIEDCIANLDDIARCLTNVPYTRNNEHLLHFNQCIHEIENEGSFKGRGIYFQQPASTITRSKAYADSQDHSFQSVINRVVIEIGNYANALSQSMKRRYLRNHSQKSFVVSRESFSLEKIRERPLHEIPDEFLDYCSLAKDCSFINVDVSQEVLNDQYTTVVQKICSTYTKYYNECGKILPENELYWEVITSDDLAQTCAPVLNLLVSAIVRNKSECIAESIGSLVKIHLDQRVSLTDRNLAQELFLHFNGPKTNRESNGLVRKALDRHFGIDNWHLNRRSHPSDLKTYEASKVIDKIHGHHGRVSVPDSAI